MSNQSHGWDCTAHVAITTEGREVLVISLWNHDQQTLLAHGVPLDQMRVQMKAGKLVPPIPDHCPEFTETP